MSDQRRRSAGLWWARRFAYGLAAVGVLVLAWRQSSADPSPGLGPFAAAWRAVDAWRRGSDDSQAATKPAPRLADPESFLAARRGRLTLLYFWSPDRPASLPWLPQLGVLDRAYGAAGLEVLGAVVPPAAESMEVYLRDHGIDWRQVEDAELAAALMRHLSGYPRLAVLIDRRGAIVESDVPNGNLEEKIVEALGLGGRAAPPALANRIVRGQARFGGQPLPPELGRRARLDVASAWRWDRPPASTLLELDAETGRYVVAGLPVGTWDLRISIGDCQEEPHDCYNGHERIGVPSRGRLWPDGIELSQRLHLIEPVESHSGALSPDDLLAHAAPVVFAWSRVSSADRYEYAVHVTDRTSRKVAAGTLSQPGLALELPAGYSYRFLVDAFRDQHRVGTLYVLRERFGSFYYDFEVAGERTVDPTEVVASLVADVRQ